jgi:hypothetical protein
MQGNIAQQISRPVFAKARYRTEHEVCIEAELCAGQGFGRKKPRSFIRVLARVFSVSGRAAEVHPRSIA